jgi:transglutaminase-like putative cysteine protease
LQRHYKTVIVLVCIILSVLLLSLSIESLGEVPTFEELQSPRLSGSKPEASPAPNPESTRLEKPSMDMSEADPIFRVRGSTGTSYLRIMAYDRYLSGLWDSSPSDPVAYTGGLLYPNLDIEASFVRVSFAVEPLTDLGTYIPTAPNTVGLNLTDLVTYFGDEMVFKCETRIEAYNLTYLRYSYGEYLLEDSDVMYQPGYLEVPEEIEGDLTALANEIADATSTPYGQLKALEEYLETHYEYNLSSPDAPAGIDPLEWFLYESGEGVCTDFNTALTLMARCLGLPARLVGGYYIDPRVPLQDVYPIQAHAFTEVPFEGLGWVIFDATPGADMTSMIEELGGFNETGELPEPSIDDIGELPVEGDVPAAGEVFRIYGATGSPYLRDGVYDYYNGSWYTHSYPSVPYYGQYVASFVEDYSSYGDYHFYVEPVEPISGFIPAPLYPWQIVVDRDLVFYPDLRLFRVEKPLTLSYEVQSEVYTFTESSMENASPCNDTNHLQVLESLKSLIAPLAERVTRGLESPYLKVKALEEDLKANYVYNTSYNRSPGGIDPVEWFLFYEGQGVCTNFNTALTLLTRSLGIPARLVTGYLVDPAAETQSVDADQAHAYTEVHFDGLGWVVFDATPAGEASKPEEPPNRTPTNTMITHQDGYVLVGSYFNVAGTVVDDQGNGVSGLDVLVYLKKEKSGDGTLAGRGVVIDGGFNVTCLFSTGLPGGEYNVDAHTLGNEVYMDSWSDPPIVSYSETEFMYDVPVKVVTGEAFNISCTLVEKHTSRAIADALCTVTVDGTTHDGFTDNEGRITLTGNLDEEGSFEVEMAYGGADYHLGTSASTSVESVPLTITPARDIDLVRDENSIIRGRVHADEIPGDSEPLTLRLEGKKISTVTNEVGEFFVSYRLPLDHELGEIPLEFTLHNNQQSVRSSAVVKARPRLNLESRQQLQAGQQHAVDVALVDDHGVSLSGKPLTLLYRCGGLSENLTATTDAAGVAEFSFKISEPEYSTVTLSAFYQGDESYTGASAVTTLTVITPSGFPVLQAAAGFLALAGVGALVYLQMKKAQEAPPEQNKTVSESETKSTRLSISLPQIRPPFPNVWGVNEELEVSVRLTTVEGSPIVNAQIDLEFNGEPRAVYTGEDGSAVTTTSCPSTGSLKTSASCNVEAVATELEVRIVEYREEIIALFNTKFTDARKRFDGIKDNYTARELLGYLKAQTPADTHGALTEMTFTFEEANYSLHPIARDSYESFYLAKIAFEEALNGE